MCSVSEESDGLPRYAEIEAAYLLPPVIGCCEEGVEEFLDSSELAGVC